MPPPAAASKATRRTGRTGAPSGAPGPRPTSGSGPTPGERVAAPSTLDVDAPRRSSYFFLVAETVVGVVAGGILITSPMNTWFTLLMLL